jgi:hypothetical protein
MFENRSRILVRHFKEPSAILGLDRELKDLANNKIKVHTYLFIQPGSEEASLIPNIKVPAYPNLLVECKDFSAKHDNLTLTEIPLDNRNELTQVLSALIQLLWASFTENYKLLPNTATEKFADLLITCPMIIFNFARSLNFNFRIVPT